VLDHKSGHEDLNFLSHAVRHRNIGFHFCTRKWVLNLKFSLKNSTGLRLNPKRPV
jgi:hypothetical protein